MYSFNFEISASHPSLEGHFTNNPVVPGVVIIDEIMKQIYITEPTIKIINIPSVKFLKPLKPDTVVDVTVIEKKPSLYQFTCRVKDDLLASGQFRAEIEEAK